MLWTVLAIGTRQHRQSLLPNALDNNNIRQGVTLTHNLAAATLCTPSRQVLFLLSSFLWSLCPHIFLSQGCSVDREISSEGWSCWGGGHSKVDQMFSWSHFFSLLSLYLVLFFFIVINYQGGYVCSGKSRLAVRYSNICLFGKVISQRPNSKIPFFVNFVIIFLLDIVLSCKL